MISVLITSSGSTPAQILARGLDSDPRVDIIHLADMKKDIATPHLLRNIRNYRQYVVPNSDSPMYVDVIKDIVSSNKIDLVIPILSQDILALQGKIPQTMSTSDSIKFCDKKISAQEFQRIGIPHPKTFGKYPVIAKPRLGMGGTGIKIIRDVKELNIFLEENNLEDYIIQEYLEGLEEFTTDVVCDRSGNPMGYCTRKRIETKGGLCTVAETVETEPEVKGYINRICDSYKFYGQINIQYLRDDEDFYFIEINPRCGGSSIISYRAGMNLSNMIVDAFLDIRRKYNIPKSGIKMIRYWNEVFLEE